MLIFSSFLLLLRWLKEGKNHWTYFSQLFIYFITVNKYWFCISVIGYLNMQIIGIGNKKKINIGRSLSGIKHLCASCAQNDALEATLSHSAVRTEKFKAQRKEILMRSVLNQFIEPFLLTVLNVSYQWWSVTKYNYFVTVLKYIFQVSVLYWSSFILSNFYFYFTTFQSIRSYFLLHYIS